MQNKIEEDELRLLMPGEIELAKSVFGSTIQYHKVWVHRGSYLPFNLQDPEASMTPQGEMYFRENYREDFSQALSEYQRLFIHEMSHVWQREKGMNVFGRGLASGLVSDRYRLDGRLLSEYPMEQQAQIIADDFILQTYGYGEWLSARLNHIITLEGNIHENVIRENYKYALRGFPW